jgi:alpha-L-arabinofuranosidase
MQGGSKMLVGEGVPASIETGRWYDIRIELSGAHIKCYLDGKLIHEVEDQTWPVMTAVASRTHAGEIIAKVVNLSDTAQETAVRIDGAKAPMDGTMTVLTSGRPTDENSLGEPTKVAPVTMKVKGVGAEFKHTFPAYSLTVMRLKGE